MAERLNLSHRQRGLVESAARSVPVACRNDFKCRVLGHLFGEPSDAAVLAAVNAALDRLPTFFLQDSDQTNNKQIKEQTNEAPLFALRRRRRP